MKIHNVWYVIAPLTNGLVDFISQFNKQYSHLDIVRFQQGDIERHNAVKEVLQIYGDE